MLFWAVSTLSIDTDPFRRDYFYFLLLSKHKNKLDPNSHKCKQFL